MILHHLYHLTCIVYFYSAISRLSPLGLSQSTCLMTKQEPGHGAELPLRRHAAGTLAAREGGQLGALRGCPRLAAGARRPHPGVHVVCMDVYKSI